MFNNYSTLVDSLFPPAADIAVSQISVETVQLLKCAIHEGELATEEILEMKDRYRTHHVLTTDRHSPETEERLSKNTKAISLHRLSCRDPLLAKLHSEVQKHFWVDIGSPFVIVNSRMWITHPSSERFGPNDFHKDGFEPGHMKCMIYLQPLTFESGYFVFKDKTNQDFALINLPEGTAVLFKNSEITHSGIPGTLKPRISIEITIMRSLVNHPQLWTGHYFGRHLHTPTIFHYITQPVNYDKSDYWLGHENNSRKKVNIGSGIRNWDNWICFDEITHEGVTRISFDSEVDLPLSDESVDLFYTSHCIEHLDDFTLIRLLEEIKRCGTEGASLVIKIPNYDYFMNCFDLNLSTAMHGKGVESVIHTWAGRLNDTLKNRIAMMFCGYWNRAYGDHFVNKINNTPDAYHGPPILREDELAEIFESRSPRQIANRLREHALRDPEFHRFNHQNAWGAEEMVDFLESHGFQVLSKNSHFIIQRFRGVIPDIDSMSTWSSFFLASLRSGVRSLAR